MENRDALISKSVKRFTMCMLGIIIFAVLIEAIVSIVVIHGNTRGKTIIKDKYDSVVNREDRGVSDTTKKHERTVTINNHDSIVIYKDINDTNACNILGYTTTNKRLGCNLTVLTLFLVFFPVLILVGVLCLVRRFYKKLYKTIVPKSKANCPKNKILLVGDRPNNTLCLWETFKSCEITIDTTQKTDCALEFLKNNNYCAIIYTMEYGNPDMEKKKIIDEIKKMDTKIPLFSYNRD
jgi:hypothetical protein